MKQEFKELSEGLSKWALEEEQKGFSYLIPVQKQTEQINYGMTFPWMTETENKNNKSTFPLMRHVNGGVPAGGMRKPVLFDILKIIWRWWYSSK